MIIKTYASILLNDFDQKKNLLSINKFRKGPAHYKIWLLVMNNYFNKINTPLESVMTLLSKNISRKTAGIILAELTDEQLIEKHKDVSDNRIITITPTERTIREFTEWIQILKSELNSVQS
tara:strand:+ start:1658 stop:2020 length:363 start_codon:yes stop_codon:yes gene_type:complete